MSRQSQALSDAESSRAFLESLFVDKPSDLYLLLWTLPEKESRWFRDVERAIRCAAQFASHDLYVGVGLAIQAYGPTHRYLSDEIAGIVGVWADIDLKSDAHAKATLPETIEQALGILPPELPPSIVLLTGNGAHIWWLFREPWIFESDEERNRASALAYRWQTLLRDNSNQSGYTFERLADLARVLRVPGTANCKDAANPKPVTIHSNSDVRYNPSDLAEFLDELGVLDEKAEASSTQAWAERFKDTPLTINLSARVPDETLTRWQADDARFKNTWFRQRSDLPDQSQSGYDMALANFGYRQGLPEQEIVNLIIHHRAIFKQKSRTSIEYYQRTLAKAAESSRKIPANFSSEESVPTDPDEATPAIDTASVDDKARLTRAALCKGLSAAFGIEILRIVKISGSQPFYRLETASGKIEFDSAAKLINQTSVRNALAGAAGKLILKFKPRVWDGIAQAMLDACIVEEGSEELYQDGAARMYLQPYLEETSFISALEGQATQDLRKPLVRAGRITVCASDLQLHINKTTQQNLSVKAVASLLSAIGARTIRVRIKKMKEQSRWELPLGRIRSR